jgi:hypothetical protein
LLKGYVIGYASRKEPDESGIVDVGFDHRPQKGMVVNTRQQAEMECALLNALRIKIPSALGGPHICQGFKPEERGPGEFVIFCEAPFLSKTPVQGQGKS